jgi:carbonic anhydrase
VIYPLEVHFVHADADGNLAVVGVMIKEGAEDNAAFESVWANLPTEETEPTAIDGATVNAADILPADHLFYTYSGSLTTPPCSEGVHWMVLTAPITMSVEQLAAFSDIFSLNARPVQPLNERSLTADSGTDS